MSLIDNKAPRRLRALIYNRVSSDPTGRAVSVSSQDVENRATCDREGWDVVATVTDNDRSASRFATRARDGYAEVHRAMAAGEIDVLVCWEASRVDREIGTYSKFRDLCADNGVLWAYSGRVYDLTRTDDRFTTGMDVLLAEREASHLRDRVMRGINSNIIAGRPHGTTPYGYMRLRDERTGVTTDQVPDPETAPVVREIVARVLSGETLYGIVLDLNERGVQTPQGRKAGDPTRLWRSVMVRKLLRSQSMIGVRTHKGVPHAAATWEPIVSVADWEQVQVVLDDPNRARNHRGVRVRYLLSGVAVCGPCGAWMRPATNRGRAVYQCAGHGVGHELGKGHVSRPRDLMDAMATYEVLRRLKDPNLLETIARQRDGADERTREAVRAIAGLEAQLLRYEQAAIKSQEDGGTPPESFFRIEAGLTARIGALRRELGQRSVLPQSVLDLAGPDADDGWKKLEGNLPVQRQIVRALLRVVVHRSTQRRGVRSADASTIEISDL